MDIKSLGNIETGIDFSKKLYTFEKYHKLKKIIKYPLLKNRMLVQTLGEITWIVDYYMAEVKYCPTLFFVIMLLVNFMSKQEVFYMIKTMVDISNVRIFRN
jgi:hypothetical protein